MINFIMSICNHSGNRVVFVMRIFQGHVGIVRFVRGPGAGGRKRWQIITITIKNTENGATKFYAGIGTSARNVCGTERRRWRP